MRVIIFVFFGLLLSKSTIGQDKNQMICFFKIGESIEKYKDVISCAENDSTSKYVSNSTCRAYRYLPAEKDSISIGNINFGIVFLHPNIQKEISTISFIRNIISKDSTQLRIEIEKEYKILTNFIDSLYKIKGSKLNIEESEFYTEESMIWKINNVTTCLKKNISTKRKSKKKILYINTLNLSIY